MKQNNVKATHLTSMFFCLYFQVAMGRTLDLRVTASVVVQEHCRWISQQRGYPDSGSGDHTLIDIYSQFLLTMLSVSAFTISIYKAGETGLYMLHLEVLSLDFVEKLNFRTLLRQKYLFKQYCIKGNSVMWVFKVLLRMSFLLTDDNSFI